MPTTLTARAGFKKPDVNGLIDVSELNDNADRADELVGFTVCTSGTRPSSPFQGQPILETDTGNRYYWSGAYWRGIGTLTCTSGARPTNQLEGQAIYETDTKNTLRYNGTNWIREGQLPAGSSVKSSNQSLPPAAITVVTMSGLLSGTAAGDFALSGNALQVLKAGRYLVGYQLYFGAGAAGWQRWGGLFKNSDVTATVSTEVELPSSSAIGCALSASRVVDLAVNDTLTLKALQTSGSSLNVMGPAGTNVSGTFIWATGVRDIVG